MSNVAVVIASLDPAVLDLLAKSYARPVEETVERAVRQPKASKPSKLAAVKAAAAEREEQANPTARVKREGAVLPPTFLSHEPDKHNNTMPRPGTYTARTFLVVMRQARTRDDQIRAIAGFIGYEVAGDFGAQCLAAKMQAERTMRPFAALPAPVHTGAPSVRGYVAGACDPAAKHTADLQARERLSAEAIATLDLVINDPSKVTPEHMAMLVERFGFEESLVRSQALLLRGVEEKRLEQIRADLGV